MRRAVRAFVYEELPVGMHQEAYAKHNTPPAVQTWREDTKNFTELPELHAWLHGTHLCYSVSRQVGCWGLPYFGPLPLCVTV